MQWKDYNKPGEDFYSECRINKVLLCFIAESAWGKPGFDGGFEFYDEYGISLATHKVCDGVKTIDAAKRKVEIVLQRMQEKIKKTLEI